MLIQPGARGRTSRRAILPGSGHASNGGDPHSALLARSPALRSMVLASFASALGDRLHQVALAALVLGLTNSLFHAGLVFVVSTLPYALLSVAVGPLVDRWDRRRTMLGADVARAALVVLIPLAATASLPLIYALIFAVTCATLLFSPAQQAAVPDLVPSDDLVAANALFQTARYLTDLLGFPLAGALVAVLVQTLGLLAGTQLAFALDALSFLASALLLMRLPGLPPAAGAAQPAAATLRRQVAEGMRFLLQHAQIRTNTLLFGIGPLLLGSLYTLWVGFAWRVSQTGAWGFGLTEAANGAGTLLGLLVLPRLAQSFNAGRLILLGFLLMGAATLGVGLTDILLVAAVLSAVAGAGNMFFLVPSVTLVQRQTPSELRGRVLGVRYTLTYAAFSLSNAAAGVLSETFGVGPLLVTLGAATMLMAVVASRFPSAREAA